MTRTEDLSMTSEITYAEVKFNKPKSSGTKSEPPAGKTRFAVVRVNDGMKGEEKIL